MNPFFKFALIAFSLTVFCQQSLAQNEPQRLTTIDELKEFFAEAVQSQFENTSIEEGDDGRLNISAPDDKSLSVGVGNLWAKIKDMEASDQQDEIKLYLIAVGDAINVDKMKTEALQRENIMPLIKSQDYIDQVTNEDGESKMMVEPFTEGLYVVYVLDTESSMVSFREEDAEELGLDPTDVRGVALKNLNDKFENYTLGKIGEKTFVLSADGNYDASLILLNSVREKFSELVDGELVALIPSRDVLLLTGKGGANLAAMKKKTREIFEEDAYSISSLPLVWREDKWMELND